MRMSTVLAASMPPITAVPITWRATEPAPDAVYIGVDSAMPDDGHGQITCS